MTNEKDKKIMNEHGLDNAEDKEHVEANSEEEIAEMEKSIDLSIPVIPLRGLTVFPNMVLHFDIGREKSINALELGTSRLGNVAEVV